MRKLGIVAVAAVIAGCAGAPTGPGKVISEPIGAPAEAIIRSVDKGLPLGKLPMNPVYEVELAPGKHELNLLCIPKQGQSGKMGPVNFTMDVEPEKTYKLTARPSGKADPVCDISVVED